MVNVFSREFDPEKHLWTPPPKPICYHGWPAIEFTSTKQRPGETFCKCKLFNNSRYNCGYWEWLADFNNRVSEYECLDKKVVRYPTWDPDPVPPIQPPAHPPAGFLTASELPHAHVAVPASSLLSIGDAASATVVTNDRGGSPERARQDEVGTTQPQTRTEQMTQMARPASSARQRTESGSSRGRSSPAITGRRPRDENEAVAADESGPRPSKLSRWAGVPYFEEPTSTFRSAREMDVAPPSTQGRAKGSGGSRAASVAPEGAELPGRTGPGSVGGRTDLRGEGKGKGPLVDVGRRALEQIVGVNSSGQMDPITVRATPSKSGGGARFPVDDRPASSRSAGAGAGVRRPTWMETVHDGYRDVAWPVGERVNVEHIEMAFTPPPGDQVDRFGRVATPPGPVDLAEVDEAVHQGRMDRLRSVGLQGRVDNVLRECERDPEFLRQLMSSIRGKRSSTAERTYERAMSSSTYDDAGPDEQDL